MKQLIRYFWVGAAATVIDFALFFFLVKIIGLFWFISAILSFLLSALFNYQLSIRYVFTAGARFRKHSEITLVFLASSLGLGLNQGILYLCIEQLHTPLLFAKVCATGLVFFWNFGIRRSYLFKSSATTTIKRVSL
ncbi:MAG: hypothetical protein A3J38_01575 [Gammaproteobacteria bacterium RIFCSPHIGHO2_12_FULL_45_9]|nr:MAG: hypothetical protein A3J38_01575 [Gammaproteobacteria bacterium RIFCSPHIGHO2_12_FULL_45_9]